MKTRFIAILAFVACLAASCRNGGTLLPNVSGRAGEVLVVIERSQWEGNVGNAIRDLLADDTPYLAQREPLFNLSNVPPGSFGNMFKVHRNILIVNIGPQVDREGFSWKHDEWARPQAVVQLSAPDERTALDYIESEGVLLAEFFEQAERDRVIANAKLYEEISLREPVETLTGGVINFPSGYRLRKRTDSFLWIADEKQYINQTVLIYRYPADEPSPFSVDRIIARRNAVMQENVPGMFDGSYMTTSTAVEPTTRSLRYHGRDFMETRGFWEVQGDFMGGPFVSHSFYSPDGADIIVIEAFVYCPRYDKRQYLRQVESLLYSFEWKKDEK